MAGTSLGLAQTALAAALVGAVGGGLAYATFRQVAPPPSPEAEAPLTGKLPAPAEAPEPAAVRPRFDLLRVAPDGGTVAAGRAEPNATVTIYAGDTPVAEARSDASGAFVAIFQAPLSAEPQALTLESATAAGARVASAEVALLLPAAPSASGAEEPPPDLLSAAPPAGEGETGAEPAVEEAADEPAGDPAPGELAAETSRDARTGERTAAEIEAASAELGIAATAILRGEAAEAELTESGREALTLASISYGETGGVTLAGGGAAGARLRVYVDDRFAREGEVDARGRWSVELDEVEGGVRRLRIDALDAAGDVARRLETPFQRDFPTPRAGASPATVTVQPGNDLWTLARIHYGEGVRYTQIYTANRDLIRNPDLIYPGQIFSLPKDETGDEAKGARAD